MTVSDRPSLPVNSVDAQGASPSAWPPSRFAPTTVVSTRFALRRKSPAGIIEIVGMLIVAEQHGIDFADRVRAERRARQLLELHMRQLIGPRRIEGRIGEQPEAIDFDQGGGTADQGDAK